VDVAPGERTDEQTALTDRERVSRLLSWREKQVSRRRSQRENGLADGAHGQRTGEQTELNDRERLADGAHGQ